MRGPAAHVVGIALAIAGATATSALAAVAERYEDGLAAYQKNDFERSLKMLRPLAEKGDARAQYVLGRMYQFGQGVKADRAEAYYWYKRAEAKNHLEARLFRQLLEQRWKISAAEKARAEHKLAALTAPAKPAVAAKSDVRVKPEKPRLEVATLRETIKPAPPKPEPAKSDTVKSRPDLPRTKPEATTEVAARIAPPDEEKSTRYEPRAEVVRPDPPRQPAHRADDDDERETAYAHNGPPAETRTPMPSAPEYSQPPQNYPPAPTYTQPGPTYPQPPPYYSPAAPPSWGSIYADPGPGPYYAPRWGYQPYFGFRYTGYTGWRGYAGYRAGYRGRW